MLDYIKHYGNKADMGRRFLRAKDFPGNLSDRLDEFGTQPSKVLERIVAEVVRNPVAFFKGTDHIYLNVPVGDIPHKSDLSLMLRKSDKRGNENAWKFNLLMTGHIGLTGYASARDIWANVIAIYVNKHTKQKDKIDLSALPGIKAIDLSPEVLQHYLVELESSQTARFLLMSAEKPASASKADNAPVSLITPATTGDMNQLINERMQSGDPLTQAARKQINEKRRREEADRIWAGAEAVRNDNGGKNPEGDKHSRS